MDAVQTADILHLPLHLFDKVAVHLDNMDILNFARTSKDAEHYVKISRRYFSNVKIRVNLDSARFSCIDKEQKQLILSYWPLKGKKCNVYFAYDLAYGRVPGFRGGARIIRGIERNQEIVDSHVKRAVKDFDLNFCAPNVIIGSMSFSVGSPTDYRSTGFYNHLKRTMTASKTQLKVKKLTFTTRVNRKEIMELLPFFNPYYLEELHIDSLDMTFPLWPITETEHWKNLKKATFGRSNFQIEKFLEIGEVEDKRKTIKLRDYQKFIETALTVHDKKIDVTIKITDEIDPAVMNAFELLAKFNNEPDTSRFIQFPNNNNKFLKIQIFDDRTYGWEAEYFTVFKVSKVDRA